MYQIAMYIYQKSMYIYQNPLFNNKSNNKIININKKNCNIVFRGVIISDLVFVDKIFKVIMKISNKIGLFVNFFIHFTNF